MHDGCRLYARRKMGEGMGIRYRITAFMPLLNLFLVSLVLSFALCFISSVSSEIDRMIMILGSGTVYSSSDPSGYALQGAEVAPVRSGSGLLYSEKGESAVMLKGVGNGYFSGMRGEELSIEVYDQECVNPVVVSSALSDDLSLDLGDRFTLLVWEEGRGRARPFLCTVKAVFSSVYPQLDSHLAYVGISLLSSPVGFEMLLPEGADPDSVCTQLWENGIGAQTYRTMYASLYGNVRASIGILYIILAAVALLAAFFSSDAAQSYISRDRKDIHELWMLGMERSAIRGIYFRITLFSVTAAALSGIIIGILFSLLSPLAIAAVAATEPAFLDYYVTSFSVTIPAVPLAAMAVMIEAVSALSVAFSLRSRAFQLS